MPPRVVTVVRTPPLGEPPPTTFLAGAAEADITPNPGIPTAGYSFMAKDGNGAHGRLFARALYLRDATGSAVAVVLLDMMSASRYLLEKAASFSAPETGITVDRLFLAGTHTHTAPAWFYAQTLYDMFASSSRGFDGPLADWMARRIADAIAEARRRAVPATVGVDEARVWGVSRNRSYPPFTRNPEFPRWNDPDMPGASPLAGLKSRQRAVDPRVRVLSAFRASDGKPIAAFGWFACHGGALGTSVEYYAPDWWGYAIRTARREIEREHSCEGVVVAMAASGAGDVNALRPGPDDPVEQDPKEGVDDPMPAGPLLAAFAGEPVGKALAVACTSAQATAGTPPVVARFREYSKVNPEGVVPDEYRLGSPWCFGAATIGGSEESRTEFWRLGLVHEGDTDDHFPPDDPQNPKPQAAGPVQDLLRRLFDLAPTPVLPLNVLRLGDDVIASVPGEPTGTTAWRIEKALLDATWGEPTPGPPKRVLVSGYANDFGAYYATREEYREQYYEGASTLYGRNSSAHVGWRLATIAGEPPDARPVGTVEFETAPEPWNQRFHPLDDCPGSVNPSPAVSRVAGRVTVSWRMPLGCRIALWRGPFVQVLAPDGAPYSLPEDRGRPYDDVTQAVLVQRHRSDGLFPPAERALGRMGWPEGWSAEFDLPFDAPDGLAVRVTARDGFPGFTLPIPR